MFLIRNILIIEPIDIHLLFAMPRAQQFHEIALKLVGVLVDDFAGILADDAHVPHVRLGGNVAFEAVLVAALFCAYLAVPAEALKAFRFHLVGDLLRRTHFGAWHCEGRCPEGLEVLRGKRAPVRLEERSSL